MVHERDEHFLLEVVTLLVGDRAAAHAQGRQAFQVLQMLQLIDRLDIVAVEDKLLERRQLREIGERIDLAARQVQLLELGEVLEALERSQRLILLQAEILKTLETRQALAVHQLVLVEAEHAESGMRHQVALGDLILIEQKPGDARRLNLRQLGDLVAGQVDLLQVLELLAVHREEFDVADLVVRGVQLVEVRQRFDLVNREERVLAQVKHAQVLVLFDGAHALVSARVHVKQFLHGRVLLLDIEIGESIRGTIYNNILVINSFDLLLTRRLLQVGEAVLNGLLFEDDLGFWGLFIGLLGSGVGHIDCLKF